jgi:hypothetical protein
MAAKIYFLLNIRQMKYFSILLLLAVLTYSCENSYTKEYNLVRTGEVSDIDSSGAWFNGLITNETADSIIDHGFVWGFIGQPVIETSTFNISLGFIEGSKTFKTLISHLQLETGVPMYIRAFVRTKYYISYGAQVKFTYNIAENPPEILNVEPDSLSWGDRVIINGKNFSLVPDNISGQFRMFTGDNGYRALISDTYTKSRLEGILTPPAGKTDLGSTTDLFIAANGKTSPKFTVPFLHPVIESVVPTSGLITQLFVINGKNLGHPFVNYQVSLGGINCTITQSGKGYLRVRVPDTPISGSNSLSVSFQEMTTTKENAFSVIPPEITSFSPKSGPALIFVRVNFINAPAGYKIYVGNIQVAPLPSSGTNFANIYVPALPPGEYEVKISYYSLFNIAVDKFTII